MTRLAFLPWVDAVRTILERPLLGLMPEDARDLQLMWESEMEPVIAAQAIVVDEFERSLQ